jgi:hypothetical protein
MRCRFCETRLGEYPFHYGDLLFCCECMSALCSWFLDGGTVTDPDMFAALGIHPPEETDDAAV